MTWPCRLACRLDISSAAGDALARDVADGDAETTVALGEEVEVVAADLPAGHADARSPRSPRPAARWSAAGAPGSARAVSSSCCRRSLARACSRPCFTATVISLKLVARSPNSSSLGISMRVSRSPVARRRVPRCSSCTAVVMPSAMRTPKTRAKTSMTSSVTATMPRTTTIAMLNSLRPPRNSSRRSARLVLTVSSSWPSSSSVSVEDRRARGSTRRSTSAAARSRRPADARDTARTGALSDGDPLLVVEGQLDPLRRGVGRRTCPRSRRRRAGSARDGRSSGCRAAGPSARGGSPGSAPARVRRRPPTRPSNRPPRGLAYVTAQPRRRRAGAVGARPGETVRGRQTVQPAPRRPFLPPRLHDVGAAVGPAAAERAPDQQQADDRQDHQGHDADEDRRRRRASGRNRRKCRRMWTTRSTGVAARKTIRTTRAMVATLRNGPSARFGSTARAITSGTHTTQKRTARGRSPRRRCVLQAAQQHGADEDGRRHGAAGRPPEATRSTKARHRQHTPATTRRRRRPNQT